LLAIAAPRSYFYVHPVPLPASFNLLLAFTSHRDICISAVSRRARDLDGGAFEKFRAIPRELRKLMLRVVNNN